MKKLLLIIALLFGMSAFAQEISIYNRSTGERVGIDSIQILHPRTKSILAVANDSNIYRVLDSLNNLYRTDEFDLLYYLEDGVVYRNNMLKGTKPE